MKQEKQRCLACGHIISLREVTLYSGMVSVAYRVFKWCEKKGRHEFRTKEVKHLFTTSDSARFGDWILLGGGIFYKNKRGYWGVNMQRADLFFKGQYKIQKHILKNPTTGEIVKQGGEISIDEVPNLNEFLSENGEFQTRYFSHKFRDAIVRNNDGSIDKIIKLPI